MRILLILVLSCMVVASCTYDREAESLKSPCVGAEGSPCGDRRPVNPHMMPAHSLKA